MSEAYGNRSGKTAGRTVLILAVSVPLVLAAALYVWVVYFPPSFI